MSESEAALNGDAILATYRPAKAAFELASSIDENSTQKYKSGTAPKSHRFSPAPVSSEWSLDPHPRSSSRCPSEAESAPFASKIKIKFSIYPSATSPEARPGVIKFAPREIYGLPTVEGRKDTIGGELTLQVPAGPLTVEVGVDTPFANGFWSSPWKKSNRAVFLRGVTMREQPRTSKFDELTQEEWKALIPYEEEWESRLTDQAVRVAPIQSLTLSK
ncbi:hypothetical protein MBM_00164 [Drepanopeziza brunnea f. sp. 'multigermtubi' MB_m1]|uniref:Uncharacterized protein n=1 Tax=Marssonina brunnea f. sp. multigermtubi (strain MB_m1) TaxID=1072389 RepID=K1X7J6_MARBU|nr:uncharacterized protein MBM_00164 [Drepanopeziza brunnea f. sp. 'multigermtubi' MB_m1]EKD21051.1 hypothetical protein MBM_00164 [Drepanopeziza brunnea f. sp. 'multigermtubi' MB_m1]